MKGEIPLDVYLGKRGAKTSILIVVGLTTDMIWATAYLNE